MNENIEKPDFKQIVLLNIQQLTNFPYIEKDFDSLTDYGLLCEVVEKMNEVITNNNIQNETVNSLYEAFLALKNYVDNYFDSIDFQELVDNKINEMVSDGSLIRLISSYLNYVTPEMYGCVGDGTTDDTINFKNAIQSGLKIIGDKTKIYKIDQIIIPNNIEIENCNFYSDSYEANEETGYNDLSILKVSGKKLILNNCSFDSIQNQIPYESLKADPLTAYGRGSNLAFIGANENAEVYVNNCRFDHGSIGDFLQSTLYLTNSILDNGEHGMFSSGSDINIDNTIFNLSTSVNAQGGSLYHCFYISFNKTFSANNIIVNANGRLAPELNFRSARGSEPNIKNAYINNSIINTNNPTGAGQYYTSSVYIKNSEINCARIGGVGQNGQCYLDNNRINFIDVSEEANSCFTREMKVSNCIIKKYGNKRLAETGLTFNKCEITFNDLTSINYGFASSNSYNAITFNECIMNYPDTASTFHATRVMTIYNNCIINGNVTPSQGSAQIVKMFNTIFKNVNPTLSSTGQWQYDIMGWDSTNSVFVHSTNIE